jgi:hypothetical protein
MLIVTNGHAQYPWPYTSRQNCRFPAIHTPFGGPWELPLLCLQLFSIRGLGVGEFCTKSGEGFPRFVPGTSPVWSGIELLCSCLMVVTKRSEIR